MLVVAAHHDRTRAMAVSKVLSKFATWLAAVFNEAFTTTLDDVNKEVEANLFPAILLH